MLTAVFTSWRVVMNNPVAMALWAGLIMGLTLLGIASLMLEPGDRGALARARELARLPRPRRRLRRPRRAAPERRRGAACSASEDQIAWFGLTFPG